jgi:hypothetical protein
LRRPETTKNVRAGELKYKRGTHGSLVAASN